VGEVLGQVDPALLGRIMISIKDRNWDSVEGMWKLKEEVKADPDLKAVFEAGQTAAAILPGLEKSVKGRAFLKNVEAYAKEFGVRAMYTHEYVYKLWVEDHTPIIEMIKGYLANDYDFPAVYQRSKDDQAKAFYLHHGFVSFGSQPRQLVLPLTKLILKG